MEPFEYAIEFNNVTYGVVTFHNVNESLRGRIIAILDRLVSNSRGRELFETDQFQKSWYGRF